RMMRVTFLVDGESVTVEVPMLEDLPYQSVDALREAIQSAAQDPESPLYGVIDPNEIGISPGAEEGDDYVLTLQALEAGENAFLITNASLDMPGKAEVKTFAFSDDSSDYFEGGEIHLSIMGYGTVDLPMVAREPVLTLTQAAVSLNELIGENEALANIISKVDVDVVDGGVHLIFTAAHETASALPISAAIDYYGELQTS